MVSPMEGLSGKLPLFWTKLGVGDVSGSLKLFAVAESVFVSGQKPGCRFKNQ